MSVFTRVHDLPRRDISKDEFVASWFETALRASSP
jgi:hypothetical protein